MKNSIANGLTLIVSFLIAGPLFAQTPFKGPLPVPAPKGAPKEIDRSRVGYMGARLVEDEVKGVVVADVLPNSPAASAGLQRDDVVTAVAGQEVKTAQGAIDIVQRHKPGEILEVKVRRGDTATALKILLTTLPAPVPAMNPLSVDLLQQLQAFQNEITRLQDETVRLGKLQGGGKTETTPQAFLGVSLDGAAKDCKVETVLSNSPADKAGLRPNDVITKVGEHPINNADDLSDAVQSMRPGYETTLQIQRGEEMVSARVVFGRRPL